MKANQKRLLSVRINCSDCFYVQSMGYKTSKSIPDFNYSKFLRAAELKEIVSEKVVFIQDRGEIRGEINLNLKKIRRHSVSDAGKYSDKGFKRCRN